MDYCDHIDRNLIGILEENARPPVSELARRARLARSSVQERIDRMKRRGVILGYRANAGRREQSLQAYVFLTAGQRGIQRRFAAPRAFPEIITAEAISGPANIMCKASVPLLEDMEALIEELARIEGVENVTYSVVLSQKINRNDGLM